jgi:hypothetical protein
MAIYRNLYIINNREQVPSTIYLLCVNFVCYWEGIRLIFYIFLTPHLTSSSRLIWCGKGRKRIGNPQQRRYSTQTTKSPRDNVMIHIITHDTHYSLAH